MSVTLNDTIHGILDGKNFAIVATINPDGTPQTSVVWVARDGDDLLFSTTRGRRKERNISRDPRISVSIYDLANPYSYAEIRGSARITEEGASEFINTLAHKYIGKDYENDGPDDVRLIIRLTPEKVTGFSA
ncbi:MAG: PPOX class F420-dependent oxidoreductase [Sciscionella sp.]